MNDGTDDYADWLSMRELDVAAGLAKGSAFRAFKSLLGNLVEGQDYRVLDHQRSAGLAATLIARVRVYRSSVNPVLLSPAAADRVRAVMMQRETR